MLTKTLILLCCIASTHAAAQNYRCTADGRPYYSDRPCNRDTKLQAYGPATKPQQQQSPTSLPGVAKAQDHVKYLGSGCASISEAIRTGPSRGVRANVIRELQDEYQQKCAIEDQHARAQARQDRKSQTRAKLAESESSAAERKQATQLADRCYGMRDVIAIKRRRESELNAKEVEALRNLERTYDDTCVTR